MRLAGHVERMKEKTCLQGFDGETWRKETT